MLADKESLIQCQYQTISVSNIQFFNRVADKTRKSVYSKWVPSFQFCTLLIANCNKSLDGVHLRVSIQLHAV